MRPDSRGDSLSPCLVSLVIGIGAEQQVRYVVALIVQGPQQVDIAHIQLTKSSPQGLMVH